MLKKLVLSIGLMVSLISGVVMVAFGQDAEDAPLATQVSQDNVSLTIYSTRGMVLVQDERTFNLVEGLNRVPFTGIINMDLPSIAIAAEGAYVVRREYIYVDNTVSLANFMADNVGENVTLTLTDGTEYTGIMLSIDNGILLQTDDQTLVTLSLSDIQRYQFPNLATPQQAEPTLMLWIESEQAGELPISLAYTTNNLSWSTNYNVVVGADNESLDITGWMEVANYTANHYEDAQVQVISGGSNAVQFANVEQSFAAMPTATPPATMTEMPATGGGGGGYFYEGDFTYQVPQRLDLPPSSRQTLEFLAGAQIEAHNIYLFDASPRVYGYSGFITNQTYGLTEITAVQNYLEFATLQTDGTALALPPGQMRVYKEDAGGMLLLGETQLPYTPAGETVQIYLENSTEVTGERRQTEFQQLSNDVIQENFEIRLRNRGTEAITVIVPERMSRSAIWEILGSSAPYEQPDPFGIEFKVEVPAGGETVITYTVLYTRQ